MMMGIADLPIETLKLLNIHPENKKGKSKMGSVSEDTGRTGRTTTPKPATNTQLSASSSASTLPGMQSPRTTVTEMTPDGSDRARNSSSSEMTRMTSPGTPTRRTTFMSQAMAASTQVSRSASTDQCPIGERFHHGRAKSVSATELQSEAGYTSSFSDKFHNMNADAAVSTGKGIGKIVGAGFKSPLDFSLNVSKGFHNVPKLLGGDVRQVDKVTDLQSGMKTAVKVRIHAEITLLSCLNADYAINRNLASAYMRAFQALSQTPTKEPKRKAELASSKVWVAASSVYFPVLAQAFSDSPPTL